MVVEFFQIVQRRNGRFFAKFDGTVWREQFMGPHVGISDKEDPVLGRILFNASQQDGFSPCFIFINLVINSIVEIEGF